MNPPTDLTTTQKIYMPLSKLHAGHERVVSRMTAAYSVGDLTTVEMMLRYIDLIEKKTHEAARRVREYALSKAQKVDGGGRSLGMKSE